MASPEEAPQSSVLRGSSWSSCFLNPYHRKQTRAQYLNFWNILQFLPTALKEMTTIQSISKIHSFVCTACARFAETTRQEHSAVHGLSWGGRVLRRPPCSWEPWGPTIHPSRPRASHQWKQGRRAGLDDFHKEVMSSSKHHGSIFTCFWLGKEEVILNPMYFLVKLYENQISSKKSGTFLIRQWHFKKISFNC